jgi:hypothetical protein
MARSGFGEEDIDFVFSASLNYWPLSQNDFSTANNSLQFVRTTQWKLAGM